MFMHVSIYLHLELILIQEVKV